MKLNYICIIVALLSYASSSYAVKKCQGEDGKWYYGDVAAEACKKSEITVMDNRGVITDQIEVPPSQEELDKRKESEQRKQAEIARKRALEEERVRILSSYETEADIDRLRDNQLESLQGNIAVHKTYISSLTRKTSRLEKQLSEAQLQSQKENLSEQIDSVNEKIIKSKREIMNLETQINAIKAKFVDERKKFRELKDKS